MTTLSRWILTLLRVLFLPGSHSRWSLNKKKLPLVLFNHFQIFTVGPLAPAINGNRFLDSIPILGSKQNQFISPLSYNKPNHPKSNGTSGDTFSIWRWAGGFELFLHFTSHCAAPNRKPDPRRDTHTRPQPNSFFFALHNTAAAAACWIPLFHA